jgi:hypothetical protein
MDLFYKREQYIWIYRTSHLFLLSSLYAFMQQQYVFSLINSCVFVSSINYWRKPIYSWRRTLDIIVVSSTVIYKNITVYNSIAYNSITYNSFNIKLYYFIFFTGSFLYPISIYYYNNNRYWTAVYLHMLLHIMGNLANIVLYHGVIL